MRVSNAQRYRSLPAPVRDLCLPVVVLPFRYRGRDGRSGYGIMMLADTRIPRPGTPRATPQRLCIRPPTGPATEEDKGGEGTAAPKALRRRSDSR